VTTFIVGEPYDTKARRKGLELVTLEPLNDEPLQLDTLKREALTLNHEPLQLETLRTLKIKTLNHEPLQL
jgi:hypothetical protein